MFNFIANSLTCQLTVSTSDLFEDNLDWIILLSAFHGNYQPIINRNPPQTWVKPIPFPILVQTAAIFYTANTPATTTIADMLLLGFVFLLRPGEYAYTDDEATPFCLNDLQILIHNRCLHPTQCSEADLHSVNYVALEFTNQKNGVHSELVGLGRSGHLIHCPVQALINWVKHLRATCAPLTTTL